MTSRSKAFFLGFKKTLPFQSGVIPFGLLFATLAKAAGFSWGIILFLSIAVYRRPVLDSAISPEAVLLRG